MNKFQVDVAKLLRSVHRERNRKQMSLTEARIYNDVIASIEDELQTNDPKFNRTEFEGIVYEPDF
jgi:RNA polymerase-interacting CarD/CdnL/TRCF family regulator